MSQRKNVFFKIHAATDFGLLIPVFTWYVNLALACLNAGRMMS